MPRAPRIQYRNAVYHVMARGNRRNAIVFDDQDRETFVKTLGEAVGRAGWEVFAWVLMGNHYHLAIRTPEANLVDGMTWFQNTYTRRFNVRHHLWGHLYGGRYKAILVESECRYAPKHRRSYFLSLLDYIHLNPARAGIVDGVEKSLLDYPWSSLPQAYAKPPGKRLEWVAVSEGMECFGKSDTSQARKWYADT